MKNLKTKALQNETTDSFGSKRLTSFKTNLAQSAQNAVITDMFETLSDVYAFGGPSLEDFGYNPTDSNTLLYMNRMGELDNLNNGIPEAFINAFKEASKSRKLVAKTVINPKYRDAYREANKRFQYGGGDEIPLEKLNGSDKTIQDWETQYKTFVNTYGPYQKSSKNISFDDYLNAMLSNKYKNDVELFQEHVIYDKYNPNQSWKFAENPNKSEPTNTAEPAENNKAPGGKDILKEANKFLSQKGEDIKNSITKYTSDDKTQKSGKNMFVLYPQMGGLFSRRGQVPIFLDPDNVLQTEYNYRRALLRGNRLKNITITHGMPDSQYDMFNNNQVYENPSTYIPFSGGKDKGLKPYEEYGGSPYMDYMQNGGGFGKALGIGLAAAIGIPTIATTAGHAYMGWKGNKMAKPSKQFAKGTTKDFINSQGIPPMFSQLNTGMLNKENIPGMNMMGNKNPQMQQGGNMQGWQQMKDSVAEMPVIGKFVKPFKMFGEGLDQLTGGASERFTDPLGAMMKRMNFEQYTKLLNNFGSFKEIPTRQQGGEEFAKTTIRNRFDLKKATGKMLGPGLDFAAMIGRGITEPDYEQKIINSTVADNVFTSGYGNRGFNTFNPVGYDPGSYGTPVQFTGMRYGGNFMKSGGTPYKIGDEYEMTEQEIQDFIAAGGKVEFID